jgi:hypothetical protein
MRYYLDTEFIDVGYELRPLSIGLVSDDGREYYAQWFDTDSREAEEWVRQHVLPLFDNVSWRYGNEIKTEILAFIGTNIPEFWGYDPGNDWKIFSKLIEPWPEQWPRHCHDLKKLAKQKKIYGRQGLPPQTEQHHALADARWNKIAHTFLQVKAEKSI